MAHVTAKASVVQQHALQTWPVPYQGVNRPKCLPLRLVNSVGPVRHQGIRLHSEQALGKSTPESKHFAGTLHIAAAAFWLGGAPQASWSGMLHKLQHQQAAATLPPLCHHLAGWASAAKSLMSHAQSLCDLPSAGSPTGQSGDTLRQKCLDEQTLKLSIGPQP